MINGIQDNQLIAAFTALTPLLQKTLFRVLHQANPDLFDQLVAYEDPLDPIDENEVMAIVNDALNQNLNINIAHMQTLHQFGELFGVELFAFQAPQENEIAEVNSARNRTRLR